MRGAGKEKLRAGLVGCGGRGTQATVDMLTGNENVELVAMADIFEDHLEGALKNLRDPKYLARHAGITVERDAQPKEMSAQELVASVGPRVKVEPDRHFVGFDAYQKLAKSDIDIVMLATPPGYRPIHFEAAVEAGKHVFTEKPIATDATGVRRFLAAGRKAAEKKLTVMSGAQRHEDRPYVETVRKIHDGALGEIVALQANYLSGPVMHAQARDAKWGDMEWEHRNWYSFLWLCGDQIVEQHFHNLDFMNWVMGGHPAERGGERRRGLASASGTVRKHLRPHELGLRVSQRRAPEQLLPAVSQRDVPHCERHDRGDKRAQHGDRSGHEGDQRLRAGTHRHGEQHSGTGTVRRIRAVPIAESTLTCIMARESAYSGQAITWEQIVNSKQDLMPREFGYQNVNDADAIADSWRVQVCVGDRESCYRSDFKGAGGPRRRGGRRPGC